MIFSCSRTLSGFVFALLLLAAPAAAALQCGTSRIDISPEQFPVIRNGGFLEGSDSRLGDPLHARAIILIEGSTRIALVVVDSCMLDRELCDAVKTRAAAETGIRADHILISATHTHSAPSAMSYCLGSRADTNYVRYLPGKLVEAIRVAAGRTQPAQAAWTSVDAGDFTKNRRWIFRRDKMLTDPFGEKTVLANMHPGHNNPDTIGPSGPVDPWLSILSIQTLDGRPLALLANFSMHYFGGVSGTSSDYFGRFAEGIKARLAPDEEAFVGIMTQGTSGDLWWGDYTAPARQTWSIDEYTAKLLDLAETACRGLSYSAELPIGIAETRLVLERRVPDEARLAWARAVLGKMGTNRPRNQTEVYAEQALFIHENPKEEIVLQAIRIGGLGLTAIPNEVYAITGLKLKARSPLPSTFNIELANGASGYIPPPEQHALGGYTTWPARTAGLEVGAEPRIVEELLRLLERVAGRPRRVSLEATSDYSVAVSNSVPAAYWRLGEMAAGEEPIDSSGNAHTASFEGLRAYHLAGPPFRGLDRTDRSRAVHLAGGKLRVSMPVTTGDYTVEFWAWPGLTSRQKQETLFDWHTDRLEIDFDGSLKFGHRKCGLTPKQWNHIALAREGDSFAVLLNGQAALSGTVPANRPPPGSSACFGGSTDNSTPFQGKLDEVAVYPRTLQSTEVRQHFEASGVPPPPQPRASSTSPTKPAQPADLQRYAAAVLQSNPASYWPLHDSTPEQALDRSPHRRNGTFTGKAGPRQPGAPGNNFDGGRMSAGPLMFGDRYTVELWFRNELPNTDRSVTGYLFSFGPEGAGNCPGDHLGIGGTHSNPGRIFVFNGNDRNELQAGTTHIEPGTWNQMVFVRDGDQVRIHLNGDPEPEVNGVLRRTAPANATGFIGGRSDGFSNFNGALDQVSIYDRPLTPEEVADHFKASGMPSPSRSTPPAAPQPESPPLSPEQSMKQTHIRDGYVLELVAAEPLVRDPVAIDWGPDGQLWVAEMADYPYGSDGKGKAGGRIRLLLDQDDDGTYETSRLFLDDINFPTSVMAWRNGVLITAAPDILYAEDTNGDGSADVRQVLFHGFIEGNQQLRVNSLRWGLDNWIHAASGGHHAGFGKTTTITVPGSPLTFPLGSRDFRFRPDPRQLEPESGPSQFGRVRDDWGNWFGVQNSNPLWHYVLNDRYLSRNPDFAGPDPRKQLRTPPNPPVYPLKPPQKRFHSFDNAGRYTSACGPAIYRDRLLFPDTDQEWAFTCEPFHNVVQRHSLSRSGVSFEAGRAAGDGDYDFFASGDPWSQPVMARTGPDGALWIVDMYRYMIEHPDWLPPAGKQELLPFYRAGENYGRIYRIHPENIRPRPIPKLSPLTSLELVRFLDQPNGTLRDLAHRLLVERQDTTIASPLEEMARTDEDPKARLTALCTLDGLGALPSRLLIQALKDPHPAVRTHAIRLCESRNDPELVTSLVGLTGETDPAVMLQLACTLGEIGDRRAGQALVALAVAAPDDPYLQAAVMSSATPHFEAMLESLLTHPRYAQPLMAMAGTEGPRLAGMVVRLLSPEPKPWDPSQAAGQWLDFLDRKNKPLQEVFAGGEGQLAAQQVRMGEWIGEARSLAAQTGAPNASRIVALKFLLREEQTDGDLTILSNLIQPHNDPDLQSAALKTLVGRSPGRGLQMVLGGWRAYSPAVRNHLIDQLLSRPAGATALLGALRQGTVAAVDISPAHRQQLLKHPDKKVARLSEELLVTAPRGERDKVVEDYRPALTLQGAVTAGRMAFQQRCAVCHALDGVGTLIGPDLRALTDRSRESLLVAILDPSRNVEPGYLGYTVTLDNDDSVYGIVGSETGNGIIMKLLDGSERRILRRSIRTIESSRLSFMPDGLEEGLDHQGLADLMAFLESAIQPIGN